MRLQANMVSHWLLMRKKWADRKIEGRKVAVKKMNIYKTKSLPFLGQFHSVFVYFLLIGILSCTNSLETQIEINAPQDRVWAVFSDTESYGEWNPMILKFKGKMIQGAQVEVELKQPGKDAMVFTPRITSYESGRKLEWQGVFLTRWLFTGSHHFELEKISENQTLFRQSENFSGIAVPFFNFSETKTAFEMMNEALKNRAEGKN